MIKKLICFFWGHKVIVKAFTGEQMEVVGLLGNYHTVQMYKLKKLDFCKRCGKTIKN